MRQDFQVGRIFVLFLPESEAEMPLLDRPYRHHAVEEGPGLLSRQKRKKSNAYP